MKLDREGRADSIYFPRDDQAPLLRQISEINTETPARRYANNSALSVPPRSRCPPPTPPPAQRTFSVLMLRKSNFFFPATDTRMHKRAASVGNARRLFPDENSFRRIPDVHRRSSSVSAIVFHGTLSRGRRARWCPSTFST